MLEIRLLPAGNGDCLTVRVNDELRLLVDAGYRSTYTQHLKPLLRAWAAQGQHLTRCIITHVDADHITGAVDGLFPANQAAESPQVIAIEQVWHNSYRHLPQAVEASAESLSSADQHLLRGIIRAGNAVTSKLTETQEISAWQGSRLGAQLLQHGYAWNADANQAAIMAPLTVALTATTRLHVLSPTSAQLERLLERWKSELLAKGFTNQLHSGTLFDDAYECWQLAEKTGPAIKQRPIAAPTSPEEYRQIPFHEDTSPTNGSSIACVLEADGRRVLLLGDAHPSVVLQELTRLYAGESRPWWFDAIKLSHHGSFANNSPELLEATDSDCYLLSTDGGRHQHPDPATLAWIVTRPLTREGQLRRLCCNYPTATAQQFDRADWQAQYQYRIVLAPTGESLVVSW